MQTNPSQQSSNRTTNRVSLVGVQPAVGNTGAAPNDRQGRRKKRKQDEVTITIASARRAVTKEIQSIVKYSLFSKEPRVVSLAMESLFHLLEPKTNKDKDYNRTVAFNCGAPLAIVKAMDWNKDSGYAGNVLAYGCWSLSYLATVKSARPSIIGIDGFQACLQALDQHPDSSEVQVAGLYLIGHLWWDPDDRKTVAGQGGLAALMKSMKSHKQHNFVQWAGCCALCTFVSLSDSPTWAKAAVDAGAIEAVTEAMGNHPDCVELQKQGCKFLSIVASRNDDYRNMIFDAKGLVPIVEALRIHKDQRDVVKEAWKAHNALTNA